MTASDEVARYVELIESLFVGDEMPPETKIRQLRLVQRLVLGEPPEQVAHGSGYTQRKLLTWLQAIQGEGLWHWLGKKRQPDAERWQRARSGIAQMLLGQLAEEHFEATSIALLSAERYRAEDQRVGRTDTDYRLIGPDDRPVCRLNVKFHGTLFKQAQEYVGLDPTDCFALATYKIHSALQRQEDEHVPFLFLIISVPGSPRESIEGRVQEPWVWLAALTGRVVEERIAKRLSQEDWTAEIRERLRGAEFRAISARRAHKILRDRLFERVHALRLRGFNLLFRGAEINMHLSLSDEMISYSDFLSLLMRVGPLEVGLRLDRGEI